MNISTPSIDIRPAAPADEWAICRLFGELHAFNAALDPRFALADAWEHVLHDHLVHVAETGLGLTLLAWETTAASNGRPAVPVGLLMMGSHTDTPLFRHRRWAELLALYIAPPLRGGPLAQQLLEWGAAWAHEHGYERIQLYVTASNERAKRFYAAMGFQPVQEIWRKEIGQTEVEPVDDPASTAHFAHGDDLLTIHPHSLSLDEDESADEGR